MAAVYLESVFGKELLPQLLSHHLYPLPCPKSHFEYQHMTRLAGTELSSNKLIKQEWDHAFEGNTVCEHTLEALKDHINVKDNYCYMLRYLYRAEWEIGLLVKGLYWAILNTTSNSKISRPTGFVINKISEHLDFYQALIFLP